MTEVVFCKQCEAEMTQYQYEDYGGYCYDCYYFFNQDEEKGE